MKKNGVDARDKYTQRKSQSSPTIGISARRKLGLLQTNRNLAEWASYRQTGVFKVSGRNELPFFVKEKNGLLNAPSHSASLQIYTRYHCIEESSGDHLPCTPPVCQC